VFDTGVGIRDYKMFTQPGGGETAKARLTSLFVVLAANGDVPSLATTLSRSSWETSQRCPRVVRIGRAKQRKCDLQCCSIVAIMLPSWLVPQ
jgi:hypothetical protein